MALNMTSSSLISQIVIAIGEHLSPICSRISMALSITASANRNTLFFCFLLLLLSFLKGSPVYGARNKAYHVVHVKSLSPNPDCIESTRDQGKRESLKVVHRHGPCSDLKRDNVSTPTLDEIMAHDQSRVNSIQSRLNPARNMYRSSKATLQAKSGRSLGNGNYIVTVGIGTPKTDFIVTVDTGSDVNWIQCFPCLSCYQQQGPIFNSSTSQSYKNLTCTTPQCSNLIAATGITPVCARATNTCVYGVVYGDNSFSLGFLATETLTLTPSDVFPNFAFGCGLNNTGFRGAAGLLGLGRNPLSLISQTASKYGNYFSYCLPTFSSSSGTLTFGKGGITSTAMQFTQLLTDPNNPTSYFIDLIGIKVGGQTLQISESVFKTPGTIIDSGTVTTRLQPAAYDALRTRFRQLVTNYNMTQGTSIFDTCFDVSNRQTISFPTISLLFGGNVEVPIDFSGIVLSNGTVACLAFAGNTDPSDKGILGNLQQQTMDVVYDVAGGMLGFGAGGCS